MGSVFKVWEVCGVVIKVKSVLCSNWVFIWQAIHQNSRENVGEMSGY